MNLSVILFVLVCAAAIIVLRRHWAPIPLLAGCCYMTIGQGVDIGPVSLPVYRIILAVGLLRVVVRRESVAGGINTIDKMVIAWSAWVVFASLFHVRMPGAGPVYASGLVFNVTLFYFLTRVWCSDLAALMSLSRVVAWLLVPVALAMVGEHIYERNVFGAFGGVPEGVYVRNGSIRAQGPFQHPILAGTVGAVCLPLMIGIWRSYRVSAVTGVMACVAIVFASTSSGPLMSMLLGIFALLMWFCRSWLGLIRWAAVGLYVLAELTMTRPAYYLISKIDLTGSSTGWHRSRLIESAFNHLSEWWLFGTDYTGHWMATTLGDTGQHADLTNYYIHVGVIGGIPAMLLLVAIIWRAFVWVGECIRTAPVTLHQHRFMIWCLGAGLFAHAGTCLSVSYYDQSMMFFWLNIGVISSLYSVLTADATVEDVSAADPLPVSSTVKSFVKTSHSSTQARCAGTELYPGSRS